MTSFVAIKEMGPIPSFIYRLSREFWDTQATCFAHNTLSVPVGTQGTTTVVTSYIVQLSKYTLKQVSKIITKLLVSFKVM